MSFRKPRRPTGSSHSEAFWGNSRCRNSLNSGVSETASRLRQYSRPRVPSSRARSASMSLRSFMSNSSVARRAGRSRLDAVFLHEFRAKGGLRLGRLETHRRDFAPRPDELFGGSMTTDAPLHLERPLLLHQRHLIDPAVAALAAHALLHVNAVIEIDKIGQVVHPNPFQRLVVTEARA